MATVYYKVHGGRLSFAEYWRMAPDPFTFCIVAVAKLFGGMSFDFSIPRVDQLHTVEWDDIPRDTRKAMREPIQLLEGAGLSLAFFHEMPVLERHRLGVGAALLAPDGRTFATVNYARDKVQSKLDVSCVTPFDDDTFGITTTAKKQMKPQPEHVVARYPGMPADDLYDKHLGHLEEWQAERRAVRVTPQTLPGVILKGEQGHIDFHADRGVYVPMTKAEIRRIREAQEADDE